MLFWSCHTFFPKYPFCEIIVFYVIQVNTVLRTQLDISKWILPKCVWQERLRLPVDSLCEPCVCLTLKVFLCIPALTSVCKPQPSPCIPPRQTTMWLPVPLNCPDHSLDPSLFRWKNDVSSVHSLPHHPRTLLRRGTLLRGLRLSTDNWQQFVIWEWWLEKEETYRAVTRQHVSYFARAKVLWRVNSQGLIRRWHWKERKLH